MRLCAELFESLKLCLYHSSVENETLDKNGRYRMNRDKLTTALQGEYSDA